MTPLPPRRDLAQGLDSGQPFLLPLETKALPLWLRQRNRSDTVVVSFHGAVDRATRQPPVFMPSFPLRGNAPSQLAISDPALLEPGEFSLAWYSGQPGLALQQALPAVIGDVMRHLGASRVIFVGSSGGGFASLYYSWHFPDSVALVSVPQTNMRTYHKGHIRRCREGLWPGVSSDAALSDLICTDVCQLYARKVPNTVIYLQSAGDRFHLQSQMLPFAAAITSVKDSRFVLQCDFWGRLGHSGSVPPEALTRWLNAIQASPSLDVDDLLSTWHGLKAPVAAQPRPVPAAPHPNHFAPSDLDTASRLRTALLRS